MYTDFTLLSGDKSRELSREEPRCLQSGSSIYAGTNTIIMLDLFHPRFVFACLADRFKEVLMPASAQLVSHFDSIGVQPVEGMWTEVNLRSKDMLKSMADVLLNGYILTVDYGYTASEYYDPRRKNGTLVCYHNHTVDDNPYEYVGEKDITSHVDFTSLARWGRELSLDAAGYVRQRDFVLSMGYDDLLEKIKDIVNDPVDYYRLTSASKFLVMPDAMGDVFKVLLQYKGSAELPVPRGFTFRNSII